MQTLVTIQMLLARFAMRLLKRINRLDMNVFKAIKNWWRKKRAKKIGWVVMLEPDVVVLNKDAIARVETRTEVDK